MVLRALITLIFCMRISALLAQQAQCDAGAFREVVSRASASITRLHEANNKIFQENLQKLRAVNNWSEAEYLTRATPLVRDGTTAALDADNQALLAKVQSLEAANAASDAGRCAMLSELKASMDKVVANTTARWDHMLSKLGRASTASLHAGAAE